MLRYSYLSFFHIKTMLLTLLIVILESLLKTVGWPLNVVFLIRWVDFLLMYTKNLFIHIYYLPTTNFYSNLSLENYNVRSF